MMIVFQKEPLEGAQWHDIADVTYIGIIEGSVHIETKQGEMYRITAKDYLHGLKCEYNNFPTGEVRQVPL